METLNFDFLQTAALKGMASNLHMIILRDVDRAELIRRLKIRILADPAHFEAFRRLKGFLPISEGVGRLREVVAHLTARVKMNETYDAKGLPSTPAYYPPAINPSYVGIRSSKLFELMLNPTSFDDTLLTLVEPNTYEAREIWGSLFEMPSSREDFDYGFTIHMALGGASRSVGREAITMMDQYVAAIKSGMTAEAAIASIPVPKLFEATWVEDIGRSGTAYTRLMLTLPNGDVWSTPPFGLRYGVVESYDDLIAVQIGGVRADMLPRPAQ